MYQSLKEAVLKSVLDCDGDLDKMNIDNILLEAKKILTISGMKCNSSDPGDPMNMDSIFQRMNFARNLK